jgi:putative ABC transport system permease protein
MTGLLFGVSLNDPLTLAAMGCFLLDVAFAACYVPARRAARLDVTAVMRPWTARRESGL